MLRALVASLAWSGALIAAFGASPQSTAAEKAYAAFHAGAWKEAAEAYEALHRAEPADAGHAFRLGVSLAQVGETRRALEALDRAAALGWPLPQVAFRRASALARAGDRDGAIAALEGAVDAGFGQLQLLDGESAFAALREDPRFRALRAAIERSLAPCRHDPKYREFDFWLGAWDVRPSGTPASQPPAENIITLEHDGCVVQEHWQAPNSNGQSFNIWDSSRGAWFQTWVDNGGGLHEYRGNLDAEGNMVFHGELAPPRGGTGRIPTRLTFFKLGPDRVRQLSEQSHDGGKTWSVAYDLIYVRRAKR
jgi:tetratricopeptide (TPR) repeat protein